MDPILIVIIFEIHISQSIFQKEAKLRTREDIQLIQAILLKLPFFQQYRDKENGQSIINSCCKHIFLQQLPAHEIVFNIGKIHYLVYVQDSVAETFYIILEGSVEIFIRKEDGRFMPVKLLSRGESFGELALISNKLRSATITCKEDCLFAVLTKKRFNQILKEDQQAQINLNFEFMLKLPLFSGMNPVKVKNIYLSSFLQYFKNKEVLKQQGSRADCVYILKKGSVIVSITDRICKLRKTITESKQEEESIKRKFKSTKTLDLMILGEKQMIGIFEIANNVPFEYSVVCHSQDLEIFRIEKILFLNLIVRKDKENKVNRICAQFQESMKQRVASSLRVLNLYNRFLSGQKSQEKCTRYFRKDDSIQKEQINLMSQLSRIKEKERKIEFMSKDPMLNLIVKNKKDIRFEGNDEKVIHKDYLNKNKREHQIQRLKTLHETIKENEGMKQYYAISTSPKHKPFGFNSNSKFKMQLTHSKFINVDSKSQYFKQSNLNMAKNNKSLPYNKSLQFNKTVNSLSYRSHEECF